MKVLFSDMKVGRSYKTLLLVTEVVERVAKNNSAYVQFVLSDGVSIVNANKFQTTASEVEKFVKKVCEVNVETSLYNGNPSYTVKDIAEAKQGEYNIGDFVIKAPVNLDQVYNSIINGLGKCTSSIKNIAINLYEANKEKMLYWSAAKSIHHNYYGGLLYHTYRMLNMAAMACKVYPSLNHDLLVTGVALHDIGKLKELATDEMGVAEYTVDGNLFGHLLIGIEMINEEVAKNPTAYDAEEVRLLKHMIASHHSEQAMGAIRTPATREAIMLAYIDVMDARMEGCDAQYANMQNGDMMLQMAPGMGTRLYKPTI